MNSWPTFADNEITKKIIAIAIEYGTQIISAVLIFAFGIWVSKLVVKIIDKIFLTRKVDDTIRIFVTKILYYLFVIFVFIAVLSKLGVQTASLIAILGGIGIAVGLSLKSSLSNLASGIILILFRNMKVGDSIQIGSLSGTVKEINILFSKIKTSGNEIIFIPNNKFMKDALTNNSVERTRRSDCVIGIGYDDDIKKAKSLLLDLAKKDKRILKDPEPIVLVKELADSSVNLLLRYWTKREDKFLVHCEIQESIKLKFDSAKISMPYPTQDLYLHK
jgi:small conductance mechanosensitive channel